MEDISHKLTRQRKLFLGFQDSKFYGDSGMVQTPQGVTALSRAYTRPNCQFGHPSSRSWLRPWVTGSILNWDSGFFLSGSQAACIAIYMKTRSQCQTEKIPFLTIKKCKEYCSLLISKALFIDINSQANITYLPQIDLFFYIQTLKQRLSG